MGNRPVQVVLAAEVPRDCRCSWTARRHDTGGDVLITWLLIGLDDNCPLHMWLESQEYPVVKDS